jgi:thioredoxin reductase
LQQARRLGAEILVTRSVTRIDPRTLEIFLDGEEVIRTRTIILATGSRDPYLLETSVPGVLACGDVRLSPVKRVASAVGEGSMAIAFVHQYLAHDGKSPRSGT